MLPITSSKVCESRQSGKTVSPSPRKWLQWNHSMKKPALSLKLDGRPFDLNSPSAKMQAVKKHLDNSPKDGIFTSWYLQEKGIAGIHTIRACARHSSFDGYWARPSSAGPIFFGHPKAVIAFRKKLAERGK